MLDAIAIGLDLHAGLDRARARRDEHAGTDDFHHADPADVDRMERIEKAERRDRLRIGFADVENRLALFGHDFHAIDLDLDLARWSFGR
jgi:hypothetical protein